MRRAFVIACWLPLAACEDGAAPAPQVPARLEIVSAPAASVGVGADAGPLRVRVTDTRAMPRGGIVVSFRVTQGAGRVSPILDTTDASGMATAAFVASTVAGANEVSVFADGLAPVRASITGVAGSGASLNPNPRALRLSASQDSSAISVVARDAFGNATGAPVEWLARDTTLVRVATTPSLASTGAGIQVLRRPGQTWVIGRSDGVSDSVLVTVHDASSRPCDFFAIPNELAVGRSLGLDAGLACVSASDPGAEYVVVLHYNTHITGVSTTIEVTASGIVAPQTSFPIAATGPSMSGPAPDAPFESALRAREAREAPARAAGARAWHGARAPAGAAMPSIMSTLRVGDVLDLNVNAFDFCSNPKRRQARVVAVTQSAVILADNSNPPGGFSDEEYAGFGVALDTLVHPVITQAFGTPTDIDGNGRIAILFTGEVNELTGPGSGGTVLGFYYMRDLLPVRDPTGDCSGSNAAEMFYVLVPDPDGTINGNVRTKEFVRDLAVGTIAHEYQHLINASRRLYVTNSPQVNEEPWLNEGLSHIGEELVFYRATGLSPRANLGAAQIGGAARVAFDLYQRSNFARYREYLRAPSSNSPLAQSDALGVRGAAWAFLRYVADQIAPTDGALWSRLVDSRLSGVANLESVVGPTGRTVLGALRDWTTSVVADDLPAGDSWLQQPSWNFVSAIPAVLPNFGLAPRVLSDGVPATTSVRGGGSGYLRFAVAQGKQALVSARGSQVGGGLAARVTIVRIK